MVIRTTTTKSTPSTTRSTPMPTLRGGAAHVKPMQNGGSSCNKPMQNGGSKSKKSSKNDTKSSKKEKKSKKSKKTPMPKDSAWCLRCQKATKMLTQKERTTKNGRKQLVAKGACGHEVYRFV